MTQDTTALEQYVQENHETLVRIIKHSDDKFVRALALNALIKYGDDPLIADLLHELERAKDDD